MCHNELVSLLKVDNTILVTKRITYNIDVTHSTYFHGLLTKLTKHNPIWPCTPYFITLI